MTVSEELSNHIMNKIMYHKKLLEQNIATEEYLECAKHRDEINRLTAMLKPEETQG
jgi:protein-arginine kinase activator protein McsA